jgi:hypothetical protein
LHEPLGDLAYTPFQALAEIVRAIGNGTPPPSIPREGLSRLTSEDRARVGATVSRYVAALKRAGSAWFAPAEVTRTRS